MCHEGFDKSRDKGGPWSTAELEIVINTCSVTPTNLFPYKADAQAMLSEIKANSAHAPSDNTVGTIAAAIFGSILAFSQQLYRRQYI